MWLRVCQKDIRTLEPIASHCDLSRPRDSETNCSLGLDQWCLVDAFCELSQRSPLPILVEDKTIRLPSNGVSEASGFDKKFAVPLDIIKQK